MSAFHSTQGIPAIFLENISRSVLSRQRITNHLFLFACYEKSFGQQWMRGRLANISEPRQIVTGQSSLPFSSRKKSLQNAIIFCAVWAGMTHHPVPLVMDGT